MPKSIEFRYELDTNQWLVGSVDYDSEDDWSFECIYIVADPNKSWADHGVEITEYVDLYSFHGKSFSALCELAADEAISEYNQYLADEYADYRRDRMMMGD